MQPTTTPKPGLMNETNSSIKDSYLQSIIRRNQQITDHYHLDRDCFARGKFAQVRRIQHKQTGTLYAAKTIRKRRPRCGNVTEEIMHEIRVLITANRCPRIVGLFEVFETASEYILVLELAEGGELQQILDVDDYISEENCRKLMRQIIEGIRYLHSHQIAHLDIKPQNILLTSPLPEGDVKLCDFGISRLISDKWEIREIMGTTDYMPPEVLQYEPITIASDMWSIGIVTYVLLSGHSPFGGDDKVHTYSNITSGSLDFPDKLFGSVSDLAKDFIQKLLIQNPKHRLTCDECLEHEWLKTTKSISPSQPLLDSSIAITPMNELINGIETDSNSNCDEEELHQSNDNTNSNGNSPVSNVVDLNGNFISPNANGGGNSGGDTNETNTNGTETQASALTPESTNPDSCDIANNDNNKLKPNSNGQSCQTLANNNSNIISVSDGQNSDQMSESDSEEYMSLANSDHESDKENQLEVQLVEMNTDNTADKLMSKFSVPNVVAKSSSSAILSPKTNNHNNNIPMPYSKLQQKRHSSDIFPESPKLLAIINHSSSNGSSSDLLRKSSITGSGILSQTASNNNGGGAPKTVENGINNSELLPSSLSASTSTPVTIKIENETNNSSTSSASSSPPITPNKKIYLSVDDSGSNTSTPPTTTISKHNFHNRSSSSSHHSFNFATAENKQQQQHCRSVSMERLDSQTASERHRQPSIDASLGYWSDRVINGGQLASTKQLVDDHRNDNNGKQQCDSMLSFCHPNASIVANQSKTFSSNSSSSFFSSTCSATSSSMSSSSSNSVEISLNSDSWNIFRMSVNNFSQSSDNNNCLIGAESESNDNHEINHHHHHFNSLPIQLSTELNSKSTVTADTQSSMIS